MIDLQTLSDRELADLMREAGNEQIRRAQVKRALERLQLRMTAIVS